MRVKWFDADTYRRKPDVRLRLTKLVAWSEEAKTHASRGATLALVK